MAYRRVLVHQSPLFIAILAEILVRQDRLDLLLTDGAIHQVNLRHASFNDSCG